MDSAHNRVSNNNAWVMARALSRKLRIALTFGIHHHLQPLRHRGVRITAKFRPIGCASRVGCVLA